MKRTFLVTLELDPGLDPTTLALEIQDILSAELPVIEVKPWSEHTQPSSPLPVEGAAFLGMPLS